MDGETGGETERQFANIEFSYMTSAQRPVFHIAAPRSLGGWRTRTWNNQFAKQACTRSAPQS